MCDIIDSDEVCFDRSAQSTAVALGEVGVTVVSPGAHRELTRSGGFMPDTGIVLAGLGWILSSSLLLVVLIFCIHHICAFWVACANAYQKTSNNQKDGQNSDLR